MSPPPVHLLVGGLALAVAAAALDALVAAAALAMWRARRRKRRLVLAILTALDGPQRLPARGPQSRYADPEGGTLETTELFLDPSRKDGPFPTAEAPDRSIRSEPIVGIFPEKGQ